VLNEILEEQKKEAISNAEMIMIVKKILEKLEAIEQTITPNGTSDEPDRLRAVQISNKAILEGQQSLDEKLTNIQSMIKSQPVEKPQPVTVVKYRNNYKPIAWITGLSCLVIAVLFMLYNFKKNEAVAYQPSDIKYRYVKALAGTYLRRSLTATDSLYSSDPERMKQTVDSLEAGSQNSHPATIGKVPRDSVEKRRLK
jgi:hypothetical protein